MTAGPAKRRLRIRIEGTNLPGRTFGEHEDVHVAVQCRQEPVDLTPGDAVDATFEFDIDIVPADEGGWDFRGPYVQGRRGERFIYLTWGDRPPEGGFTMFRRAKLHLSCLDADLLTVAADRRRLVARLSLSDARGAPRCASLRPPAITWSAG